MLTLLLSIVSTGMAVQGRGRGLRPPNTQADRPEVICRRSLIVGRYHAGMSVNEISRVMGISKNTVRLWIRRYEEEGHVTTRPRSGRPRVTSPDADKRLVAAAREAPKKTAVTLTHELELQCDPVTTRRRLHEVGLHCYVAAEKEKLSEQQKVTRLRFAQRYRQYGVDFWQNVIFTDEKSFLSVPATGKRCWRLVNTRYDAINITERARSGRLSVCCYGWMWAAGPGELVTIDGYLNAEEYINILETSLLPSVRSYALPEPNDIILVQDRSPIHTSHAVMSWFRQHPEFHLIDWPTKGCDMNPIENLWGIMVDDWEVRDITRDAAERKTREVWESIRRRPNICTNLVNSMPSRLQAVIEAQGGMDKVLRSCDL